MGFQQAREDKNTIKEQEKETQVTVANKAL